MTHFNQLTPGEAERLALLAEECAEVIKAVTKILRHGYDSYNPHARSEGSNRRQLTEELGHVECAINMLIDKNDLDGVSIGVYRQRKAKDVQKYLHHQGATR